MAWTNRMLGVVATLGVLSLNGIAHARLVQSSLPPPGFTVRRAKSAPEHFEFYKLELAFKDYEPLDVVVPVHVLENVSTTSFVSSPFLSLLIDGEVVSTSWIDAGTITESARARCANAGNALNQVWVNTFTTDRLAPGAHSLAVEMVTNDGERKRCSRSFYLPDPAVEVVWRKIDERYPITTAPIVHRDRFVVTSCFDELRFWDRRGGTLMASKDGHGGCAQAAFDVESAEPLAIAGTVSGDVCGFRFGNGSRKYWRYHAGVRVLGTPLVVDGAAYIGDHAGRVHAVDLTTHDARWIFETRSGSIETRPCRVRDFVVVAAPDGRVYALRASDGSLAWKAAAPGAGASAAPPLPRDPLAQGEHIFVCDSSGRLARYAIHGSMTMLDIANVAAIGGSFSASSFFVRGSDDVLTRIAGDGTVLWKTAVELGSHPAAPVVSKGKVYVCSDDGLVSWVDAETGEVLDTYRVVAGAEVRGSVAVDDEGICYVAATDGSLTAMRRVRQVARK